MQGFSSISTHYENQKSLSSSYAQKKQSPFFKPFIQPKLTINQPNDIYEQEADAMANKVMRMNNDEPAQTFFQPDISHIQKKCAHCEEEEKKLQMKGDGTAAGGMIAPSIVNNVISSTGQPLDAGTRNFMESRFGNDFGNVQIHNDSLAHESSAQVNARAYTYGNHIVFGETQYQPNTKSGKQLLAHELTHVMQQGKENNIRRMTLGKGQPPDELKDRLTEVPKEELDRVMAAIELLRTIAKDRQGYENCHKSFAETCPGGNDKSLEDAFDSAILWRFKQSLSLGAGAITFGVADRKNVAYTGIGYGGGTKSLAFDLLHELGHVCGISFVAQPHYMADKLALYCLGPIEQKTDTHPAIGFGRASDTWSLVLSYGWLLHEWKAGRIGLTLNTEFDVLGALRALQDLADTTDAVGGIAGAGVNFNWRPFSGEHFGGLSFHTGIGAQFGGYRFRGPNEGDPDEIKYGAAVVFELGGRIQWWMKDSEAKDESNEVGRVKPWDLDLSYRLIQPVTPGAKRTHEVLLSKKWFF